MCIVSWRGIKNILVRILKKVFKFRIWIYIGFSYDYILGIVKMYVNGKLVVIKVIGWMEFFINRLVWVGLIRCGRRFFCGCMFCI